MGYEIVIVSKIFILYLFFFVEWGYCNNIVCDKLDIRYK